MVKVVELSAAKVDAELVESLEQLLEYAKTGRIAGLFAVVMTPKDGSLAIRHNAATHQMIGAVTVHRQIAIDDLVENTKPDLEIG